MDKNIFSEAIPTLEQKALLKQRIFETYTEKTENKTAKVFPFKQIAAIAAAFVLVVGAVALLTVLAGLGGTGIDVSYTPLDSNSGNTEHITSNGGVDGPSDIEIGVTDLKAKYPEYFGLDTSNGLMVYVWIEEAIPQKNLCTLLPKKELGYSPDDIVAMNGVTTSQMKEILSSYDTDLVAVSVSYVTNPNANFAIDINTEEYIAIMCEELGVNGRTLNFDIDISVAFKNETEFQAVFRHIGESCTHEKGEFSTSSVYDVYLNYDNEMITYGEYLRRTGAEWDNGPFVWQTVNYLINGEGLALDGDLAWTYGKLPAGKYYMMKEIFLTTQEGKLISKKFYVPFVVKETPVTSDDEKSTVISIVNGVDAKLGDGRYMNGSEYIFEFDFAVVYDTPHNFYYDTLTENGGNLPQIPTVEEITVYKKIRVGDDFNDHGFKVTEASFNANVQKDGNGNIIDFDKKIFENKLRAEGNTTVTAYAYKQSSEYEQGDVMIVINPLTNMNGDITFYRLYGEKQNSFNYVSENGGIFEAVSSIPVLTLSKANDGLFDKDGLWEVELDVAAIEMVYSERGDTNRVSLDVSDIRFIKEIEVSDPEAE